jgi:alpha-L-fucosidase
MNIRLKKTAVALFAALTLTPAALRAGNSIPDYQPTPEIIEAQKEFSDNKFGIFIHWGVYSMIAHGEWFLNREGITWHEYEKLASGFYPARFDVEKWVSTVKASGAKYICFTSRHHDSFSMFRTAESEYNIVDGTPFGRDVLKELADECQKQGIKLHLYYSHLDWRRADYPLGRTGQTTDRDKGKENWKTYYSFMNNQITELLTNYGPIGAIWFDGKWDHKPEFDWELDKQYAMIHRLQPSCLIANNHHEVPYAGENIQIFERDLPGENNAGLSGQEVSRLPLETCETMNGMWGYKIADQNYKSTRELIHLLVRAAGRNANLLLNVGPQPNGEMPDTAVQRLKEVGEWMEQYGETIYNTRIGDITPHSWGVSTRNGNRLFIHILDYQDNTIFLPLTGKVKKAVCFNDKTPLRFKQDKNGAVITLNRIPTETDYIIELTMN